MWGALALMLKTEPELRHLCCLQKPQGKLANAFRKIQVSVHNTLADRTNDRSLV